MCRTRTENAIKSRAYWVGWSADVRRVLAACVECTRYKRGKVSHRTPLQPIACGEPWELVSIDITGPHPTSREGFSWILTVQDHFSKWVEAFALRRHTAPIVARTLCDNVFMRYGCPLRLLSDRGPEFESALIADLCRLMRIDKIRTTAYNPACNGMLERFHRCLNSMLAKVVAQNQRDWPDHLPSVLAAYCATTHESTGMTPSRVFFGREMRLPIDLVMGPAPDAAGTLRNASSYADDLTERLWRDGQLVRSRLGRTAESMKTRYDAGLRPPYQLTVGAKVWYFYPRRFSKLSPKWQSLFVGPYTVVRLLDPCNAVIQRSARSRLM